MAAVLCFMAISAAAEPLGARPVTASPATTVTDIAGRQVSVPSPASRLLIDDARVLLALALIHPDPVSLVTAWPHDTNRLGPDIYARFKALAPNIDTLARVSSSSGGNFSLEQAIAAHPDVAIYTLGLGPSDAQLRQFEAAGIPVVFIDFFNAPFDHLEPSLTLLGRIVGREAQAQAFVDWRRARMARIETAVRASGDAARRTVFLEAHAGMSACCNSPGHGSIGTYISFVGGHNIGADVLPGATGRLNVEYVVSRNPDVYILTGGPHLEKAGGYVVGPGYSVDRSRASLRAMTERTGLGLLPAVRAGRVHGLSHLLLNSPLDIVAVEALASWIRPDLFADLDPAATLRELNRFLAVPLDGPLWTALN
jgi:iron complex transport system substrate-binding protein